MFENRQYAVMLGIVVVILAVYLSWAMPVVGTIALVVVSGALSYFGPQLLDELPKG